MMTLLKKFNQVLGFTPTERRVVVFLIATFLLGIGIKFYRERSASLKTFDYSQSDEEFAYYLNNVSMHDSLKQDSSKFEHDSLASRKPIKVTKKDVALKSININIATKAELMKLPGIGETTAERILAHRKEKGLFSAVEDLMNVKGIGKKKLERLAPFCTIGK